MQIERQRIGTVRSKATTLIAANLAMMAFGTTSSVLAGPIEYELEPFYSGIPDESSDFGFSLAIDGSYIAIGANYDDLDADDSGAVYVYDRATRNFLYAPYAPDVGRDDQLGFSVAINDGYLFASAIYDEVDGVESAGSVYVFDLNKNGAFHQRLSAPTGQFFDAFGWSVSAGNNLILVGAPTALVGGVQTGAVEAFTFDSASTINHLTTIEPTDGSTLGFFGGETAVSGPYVLVGSSRNDIGIGIGESGSAYLYAYTSGNLIHKLLPDDPQTGSHFGGAIAIEGNLVAVGAPFTSDRGPNSGSVYLFDAITGDQIAKIYADDTDSFDWFGESVAMDGDTLVIGAFNNDTPAGGFGSVYIYDTKTMSMIDRIDIPVIIGTSDRFGSAVAAGEGDILTSNYNQSHNGVESGVAYFINATCRADINGDGSLDFFDVSDMINNQPDYNGDGEFNFFDVSAFMSDYQAGCP